MYSWATFTALLTAGKSISGVVLPFSTREYSVPTGSLEPGHTAISSDQVDSTTIHRSEGVGPASWGILTKRYWKRKDGRGCQYICIQGRKKLGVNSFPHDMNAH